VSLPALLAQQVPPVEVVSTGETLAFWILGPLSLAGALGMIFSRNAVHSALCLALTMLCLGAMYLVQQAPFLGVVQIIVYTGAVMMLFLFVLMMVGRGAADSLVEVLRGQRLAAAVAGVGLVGLLVSALARSLAAVEPVGLVQVNSTGGGNVARIGQALFTDYLFAFELTSALLITAALGAMVLAYTERSAAAKRSQRELVSARFRGEHDRPSPLPGPGVFATADSVATPALLPDGTVAEESISEVLEAISQQRLAEDLAATTGPMPGPNARALRGPDPNPDLPREGVREAGEARQ
jgi:NADH-quinone oxidoreductase subunit J